MLLQYDHKRPYPLGGPSNRGIGAVDHVVAATTRIVDGELATTNVTHFPMFRGLRAPY